MLKEFTSIDYTKAFDSARKISELNVTRIEAAIEAQKSVAQGLMELTESRIKAVTAINDYNGYINFIKEQAELAQSSFEKMIDDSKAATEESKAYSDEIQKILSTTPEVIRPISKKAPARKAA